MVFICKMGSRSVILLLLICAVVVLFHGHGARAQVMGGADKVERRKEQKAMRLQKLVRGIEAEMNIPSFFKRSVLLGNAQHRPEGPAVFSAAMDKNMGNANVKGFAGSLRQTGYQGDIVLAISPGCREGFLEYLKKTSCISYEIATEETKTDIVYHKFKDFEVPHAPFGYSVNVMRLYMYKWWASMYNKEAIIFLSDFRDVLFQSNPFKYQPKTWMPPKYQLTVFHENFPQKMIYRCVVNSNWIRTCYGDKALTEIDRNYVSCSGTVLGGRDAVLAYAYLMIQQMNPAVRWRGHARVNSTEFLHDMQKQCKHTGIDQGFHNYLLHSGSLDSFMDIKQFPQGEGPVNTIGAFYGKKGVISMNLTEWGVLRGQPPDYTFHNWNGDLSPVVHQYDRYHNDLFKMKYWEYIKVIKDQYPVPAAGLAGGLGNKLQK